MDKRIIFLALGLLLIVGGIFTYKMLNKSKKPEAGTLNFKVDPLSVTVNNPVHFEDMTEGARNWEWDFGEGDDPMTLQKGEYTFTTSGPHTVTLIVNGVQKGTIDVMVNEPMSVTDTTRAKPVLIAGPAKARVGEKVTFTDNTPGATSYEWKFGLSGLVDATTKTASFVYTEPGVYDVVATNNTSKQQAIRKIRIEYATAVPASRPGPGPAPAPAPRPGPAMEISENALKARLQSMASSGFNDRMYKFLLPFMCGRSDVPVRINGSETTDFNSYCKRLDFLRPTITDLKYTRDASKCITAIQVTEN